MAEIAQSVEYFKVPGEEASPGTLTVPKAKELALLLEKDVLPFVHLVACRRGEQGETVIVDVEPEVAQYPENDIRHRERIAVTFDPEDLRAPDPIALRKDFPLVPHTNLRPAGTPRSLCLYETRYTDQKLQWTASGFVKQLHRWLSLTARGALHEEDQPLEVFFLGAAERIIVPSAFYSTAQPELPERLIIGAVSNGRGGRTLIARQIDAQEKPPAIDLFAGLVVDGRPRTHGVIRHQPTTLYELHEYLQEADCDLIGLLRARLMTWKEVHPDLLASPLILLVRLPKRRTDAGTVESVEVWAFGLQLTLKEIGEHLGLWEVHDTGHLAVLIGGDPARQGQEVPISLLNPTPALTRERAARLNGLAAVPNQRLLAIGIGALGSQVVTNLARAGHGPWTLVDEDQLLPHNLARHHLHGGALGFAKAEVIAATLNSLFEEPIAEAIVADVLDSDRHEALSKAFEQAETIIDMSASVTVARHLAHDVVSPARRLSLFLNPDGTDLVLLAEDAARAHRLDQLEMQYYLELTRREDLSGHLLRQGEPIRYAHSCRDVTAQIPQDLVAVHAGLGARELRRALEAGTASITVWRTTSNGATVVIPIQPHAHTSVEVGGWTLVISEELLQRLAEVRQAKLPSETGGVFVGSYDLERRIIYVVDTIPSPPDSEEWPTLYIRGAEGLSEQLQVIRERTGGWLGYVGEWHSHPVGYGLNPSRDDLQVFAWLNDYMVRDGLPPLMAIVGDSKQSHWFVGQVDQHEWIAQIDG